MTLSIPYRYGLDSLSVCRSTEGKWIIEAADGSVLGEFSTNAQAWRALDRLQNEPLNKREDTADWSFREAALSQQQRGPAA